MSTFVVNQNLATEVCCNCGVLFALPESWQEVFKKDHRTFYCPAGHPQLYTGLSEEEKLRRALANKEQELNQANEQRANAVAEADHFRRSRDGMKGALRKTCIRVKNGVCPCCKRTFSCLADHMKQKHPGYAKETTS